MARVLSKGILASVVGNDAKDKGKGFSKEKTKARVAALRQRRKDLKETDAHLETKHERIETKISTRY